MFDELDDDEYLGPWLRVSSPPLTQAQQPRRPASSSVSYRVATLNVTVKRANDLPAADRNGKSDPYVKLIYHLGQSKSSSQKQQVVFGQTTSKPCTLSPEWNETFSHAFKTSAGFNARLLRGIYIICEVWDKDLVGKDDFLGSTRVFVPANRTHAQATELWYPLVKPENVTGSVLLRTQWTIDNNDNNLLSPPEQQQQQPQQQQQQQQQQHQSQQLQQSHQQQPPLHHHQQQQQQQPQQQQQQQPPQPQQQPPLLPTPITTHLFREECPSSLLQFKCLYHETKVCDTVISLPPLDEVLLTHVDDVMLKADMGTLYLTNFRVVFVPDSVFNQPHLPNTNTTNTNTTNTNTGTNTNTNTRTHLSHSSQRTRAPHHTVLSLPLGSIARCRTEKETMAIKFECKDVQRYTFQVCLSHETRNNAEHVLATEYQLLRFHEEITWRLSEGHWCFSMCDHVLQSIRRASGYSENELVLQRVPDKITAGCCHSSRRSLTLQGSPTKRVRITTTVTPARVSQRSRLLNDYSRLSVASDKRWHVSTLNNEYKLCPTYPSVLVLPTSLDREVIIKAASHRSKSRLPVLTWIHPTSRAPLCRSVRERERECVCVLPCTPPLHCCTTSVADYDTAHSCTLPHRTLPH